MNPEHQPTPPEQQSTSEHAQESLDTDAERRAAMRKIGKYAAFTAPILLGMVSRPARAS